MKLAVRGPFVQGFPGRLVGHTFRELTQNEQAGVALQRLPRFINTPTGSSKTNGHHRHARHLAVPSCSASGPVIEHITLM